MSEQTRISVKADFVENVTLAVTLANLLNGTDETLKRIPDLEKDGAVFIKFMQTTKRPESDGSELADRVVAKYDACIAAAAEAVEVYPTLPKLERGAHLHGGRKPVSPEDRVAKLFE